MRSKRLQRGSTIVEAIIAMGVLMIGATGMIGLHRESNFLITDARRITRAAEFAQDLVNQIELWDFSDPRLAIPNVDHGEADLGANWTGLHTDLLTANGMERYWNVSYSDDYNNNGIPDAARITVTVRWPVTPGLSSTWRSIVFVTTKVNPGDAR